MLAEFGYAQGGIRFLQNDSEIQLNLKKSPKTGGFIVKFIFDDSCLVLFLNSWTCRFNIRPVCTITQYPFITKYPLDVTDENDFTIDNFKAWLNKKETATILEACVSNKGAFDMYISFMNYILWLSHIHPKTKVCMLSDNEIDCIYRYTVQLINEYKSGVRICEYINIYGDSIKSNDDAVIMMTSKNYQKPCPDCGDSIDVASGAGTKLYFCPSCQVLKSRRV